MVCDVIQKVGLEFSSCLNNLLQSHCRRSRGGGGGGEDWTSLLGHVSGMFINCTIWQHNGSITTKGVYYCTGTYKTVSISTAEQGMLDEIFTVMVSFCFEAYASSTRRF